MKWSQQSQRAVPHSSTIGSTQCSTGSTQTCPRESQIINLFVLFAHLVPPELFSRLCSSLALYSEVQLRQHEIPSSVLSFFLRLFYIVFCFSFFPDVPPTRSNLSSFVSLSGFCGIVTQFHLERVLQWSPFFLVRTGSGTAITPVHFSYHYSGNYHNPRPPLVYLG